VSPRTRTAIFSAFFACCLLLTAASSPRSGRAAAGTLLALSTTDAHAYARFRVCQARRCAIPATPRLARRQRRQEEGLEVPSAILLSQHSTNLRTLHGGQTTGEDACALLARRRGGWTARGLSSLDHRLSSLRKTPKRVWAGRAWAAAYSLHGTTAHFFTFTFS